jgi:hypothetical protein
MDPSRHGGGKKHTLVASGVRLCFHAFVADLLLYSIRDSTAGYRQRHNSQVTWTPTSAKRPRRARKLQATERDPARLSLRYPAQSTDHPRPCAPRPTGEGLGLTTHADEDCASAHAWALGGLGTGRHVPRARSPFPTFPARPDMDIRFRQPNCITRAIAIPPKMLSSLTVDPAQNDVASVGT